MAPDFLLILGEWQGEVTVRRGKVKLKGSFPKAALFPLDILILLHWEGFLVESVSNPDSILSNMY